MPFYCRKIVRNVPDVKTIHVLVREQDILEFAKGKLVMDQGFFSASDINALFKKHMKFVYGVSMILSFAKEFIREIRSRKDSYESYHYCLERDSGRERVNHEEVLY